jgi:hypothetical protein
LPNVNPIVEMLDVRPLDARPARWLHDVGALEAPLVRELMGDGDDLDEDRGRELIRQVLESLGPEAETTTTHEPAPTRERGGATRADVRSQLLSSAISSHGSAAHRCSRQPSRRYTPGSSRLGSANRSCSGWCVDPEARGTAEHVEAAVRHRLEALVAVAPAGVTPGFLVIALVGPPDGGKTTTAAKLAPRTRIAGRSIELLVVDDAPLAALRALSRRSRESWAFARRPSASRP